MGAQWKQAGRVANANKKGQIVGKLAREITVAAKLGDPNPENNPRLRAAVEAAKKHSVPRDTIERAIKKGAGLLNENVQYDHVTYEGFAPFKVPVLVECLTDNRNRTAAEIRQLFRKGQLGTQGSVSWMFDRVGIIEATINQTNVDIEAVAQNVEPMDSSEVPTGATGAIFYTESTDLDSVNKALTDLKWTITLSELGFVAKNKVELNEEQKKEVVDFLNAIDDFDDTHRIYTALK